MDTNDTHTHDTRPDAGRWTDEPGYLAQIDDPIQRRAHRAATRALGLRERRADDAEPSAHQMASLVILATSFLLAEGDTRGPETSKAFSQALRHAADETGWRLTHPTVDRIRRRLTLEPGDLELFVQKVRGARAVEQVVAAREEARRLRVERIEADRMRRYRIQPMVPEVDDPFDNVSFGDDEEAR